ncbi:MAG: stage II sporulation protein M [Otoolea sp.]|nr:stage II sporulation protein M [Clostridiaceae bacterium]MDY5482582.1 stage II sporulation protein M [Clostridium sp.]
MKRDTLSRWLSPRNGAVFCFFLGIFLGTFSFLLTGGENTVFSWLEPSGWSPGLSGLSQLLWKRCLLAGFLWLLGISLMAVPGMALFLIWCGFSMAVVIASLTRQQGIRGLPLFLAYVFPQIICYLPAVLVFVRWGFQRIKRPHLAGFLVLLLLMVLGAMLEAWVSPEVVLWISDWFS